MGFFNLFKKKTSLALTEDLDLMTWLDPFYHRQVTYIRKSHALQELVHFHAGDQSVWGYTTTPLPKRIKTLEGLLAYLKTNKKYHLK